jgi:hypothetical protein
MRGGIQQQLVFVLPVEIDERRCQLPERTGRSERAVNERPAASTLRRNLASNDQLRSIVPLENGFDRRGVFTGSHEIARGTAAGKQADGPYQDGFAGTGFAREDTQSRLELQLEPIDDGEMADAEEP